MVTSLGCVRLTLFQKRDTCEDGKKSLIRGFWNYWNTKWLLNYRALAKVCRNDFPNLLKKGNLTAIPFILIPEYGQSNATLLLQCNTDITAERDEKLFKNFKVK